MTKRTYGHTESGKPIDDELIEKLADDAETGYAVDEIIARRASAVAPDSARPHRPSSPSDSTRN